MKERWTEEEVDKAKALKKDGKTLREIASILNRSFETVKSKIYGNWDRYYNDPNKKRVAQERALKWHFDNFEQSRNNHKQWYDNNTEHHLELVRNARAANSEHYKEYIKQWQENNRDKCSEYGRRWNLLHPGARGQINDRRRVKMESIIGSYTTSEWKDRLEQFEHKCAYCQQELGRATRDHIIPLNVLPIGFIWNIVPVCNSCNSTKQDMNVLQFLEAKGYNVSVQLAETLDRCFVEFDKMSQDGE